MKKGEMNWIIISMVIGLVALILIIALLTNAFKSSNENTSCTALGGVCKNLDEFTSAPECKGSQKIFTNDCKLADKQTCCVKL